MSANVDNLKPFPQTHQTCKGHGKVTREVDSKSRKRGQNPPPGPHKTWANFVRQTLNELPWTREETAGFLEVSIGWLKKAINGYFIRGDHRDAFQDRLTKKWEEYRKDKPALKALAWPPYIESEAVEVVVHAHGNAPLLLREEPSHSRVKLEIPKIAASRIAFRGVDTRLGLLIGRDDERKALDHAWDGDAEAWQRVFNRHANSDWKLTGQPVRPRIVVFNAWAGTGKTSLVARWAADKLANANYSGIERYFDWPFHNQGTRYECTTGSTKAGDVDLFFKVALKVFGDPVLAAGNAKPWQKGERLAHLISQYRTLLILDGLEPLQDARSGELRDDGMVALLRGLAVSNLGLCLITSRQRLPELDVWRQTAAPEWELGHLTNEHGAALLTTLGVCGAEAEKRNLSAQVKGHALTLTLLGGYLKHAHHGDIRRVDCVNFKKVNEKVQGGHAFRVIAAYERWFKESNCHTALAILRILGLFDRPATPDCLASLREPPIEGLTSAFTSLDDEDWNEAVSCLVDLNLVEEQHWEPAHTVGYSKEDVMLIEQGKTIGAPKAFENRQWMIGNQRTLDTHPLIREYFAKQLCETVPISWRIAHSRLFQHLRNSVPFWPEDLDGLQFLCQSVIHGCEGGLHQEACENVYFKRILRGDQAYMVHKVGAIGTFLATLAGFFDQPWKKVSKEVEKLWQGELLNDAAYCLRALGRLGEAIQPLKSCVVICEQLGDWKRAAISANNLSELEMALGELSHALRDVDQAVAHAELDGDAFQTSINYATMGDVLHQHGRRGAALRRFREAEDLRGRKIPAEPLLKSARGFQYCDLLLAKSEIAAWKCLLSTIDSAVNDDKASRKSELLQSCHVVQGRAGRILKRIRAQNWPIDIAFEHLTLGRASLYKTLLRRLPTNVRKPEYQIHIETAVDYFRRADDMTHLPRCLLTRSWTLALQGRQDLARADLDEAWQIAKRGPMKLHLADIHLHRARLFRDKEELRHARAFIERCGYWRRKPELDDAEKAARSW